MKKPLPLTIVTAVLNEEKNLPDFLKYAKQLAEEIIVVIDYRTTDSSAKLSKNAGAKVLLDTGESKGIVFHNKNKGIKEASNDWILVLDADEKLDETAEKELHQIVEGNGEPGKTMYQTGFINFEFGKYFTESDQKDKKFIRLFKKGAFTYSISKTAEGLGIHTNALQKNRGNSFLLNIPIVRTWYIRSNPAIATMKGYILHNSHPTVNDFIRKINLYSSREAEVLYSHNPHPSMMILVLKMFWNPFKEFFYKYVVWKLYKEGSHGAIASILYSFYHFLIVAKFATLVYKGKS